MLFSKLHSLESEIIGQRHDTPICADFSLHHLEDLSYRGRVGSAGVFLDLNKQSHLPAFEWARARTFPDAYSISISALLPPRYW